MTQERLSDMAIISIESEISEKIDFTEIIDKFASQKARKVILLLLDSLCRRTDLYTFRFTKFML